MGLSPGFRFGGVLLALAVAAGAGARDASAQPFPQVRVWTYPGAFRDTLGFGNCWRIARPDSVVPQARSVVVRFLRNRVAEKRSDFGGYRIYRMYTRPDSAGLPDSSTAVLLRRFSRNAGSELTWRFSVMDTAAGSYRYVCKSDAGPIVTADDSIVTYVDPDSNGDYVKTCRRPGIIGAPCQSPGDSIFVRQTPPGPHDGFLTWYSITIEKRNTTDPDYEDLFVPDTANGMARCGDPSNPNTCPNLNNKLANVAGPVVPTAGPTVNLERVLVVPNPYRGSEAWDQPGGGEIHFINLPAQAVIRIYTVAGDLVRELHHNDTVHDFERWDLKSATGRDVASGIYVFRIVAGSFHFQNRFIVIR